MSPETTPDRSKIYLLIGCCCFLLMGLFWGLDDSFIYIFSGIGACFLFLSYWNRPQRPKVHFRQDSHRSQRPAQADWNDVFNSGKPSSQQKTRMITLAVILIFIGFFVFVSFIISAVESIGDQVGFSGDATSAYQMAEFYRSSQEYDSAGYYYRKALQFQPENIETLNAYGIFWMEQNRNDSALYYFNRVLDLDDEYIYAQYNIALLYYNRPDYRKSIQECRKLLRKNRDYSPARLLLGDNYYSQQRYDSAIVWYEEAYQRGERGAELSHIMAYIYDQRGDQTKAIPFYKEAVSYDSSKTEACQRLGELLPGRDGDVYRSLANRVR